MSGGSYSYAYARVVTWAIFCKYLNLPEEEIDTAETAEEADMMVCEYRVAFGKGAVIWSKEVESD